jgi:DNA-binding HxlR family transcriptional regulator
VLAVVEPASGVRRFSEVRRALDGISQRMLTLTLRRLERGG